MAGRKALRRRRARAQVLDKTPPQTRQGDRGAQGIRLGPQHDVRMRGLIDTERTINRLNAFLFGDPSNAKAFKKVAMTSGQLYAAFGILKGISVSSCKIRLKDAEKAQETIIVQANKVISRRSARCFRGRAPTKLNKSRWAVDDQSGTVE